MALAKTVLNMDNPNNPWMNFVKFASHVHAVMPAWTNMRPNTSEKNSCFIAKHHLPTVPPKSRVSQCFSDHTRLTSPTSASLADHWREIQGLNNWENLIQPSLHPLLQSEIIRYGKFVTACYEAFDLDPGSPRYLSCKYGRKTVLAEVGLGDSGYQVTKYIYATAPDINIPTQNGAPAARWVGYIAVSTDLETARLGRRDVLVTFRGTITNAEWIANLMSALCPARLDPHDLRSDVKVEAGFLSLYTSSESGTRFGLGSCREQTLSEISRLVRKYKDEEMSITLAGHSMGSSLALLLAYDIAELGLNYRNVPDWSEMNKKIPVTVFSFAGPRVGNVQFKVRCEELGVKVLRVVHAGDPITKLPGVVFNELTFRVLGGMYDQFPWSYDCYAHVGVELVLDFLEDTEDEEEEAVHQLPEITDEYASPEKGLFDFSKISHIFCVHDLETYIGLLMRCSKRRRKIDRKLGLDFLGKAKELLLNATQCREASPWREAAIAVWCCLIIGNQIRMIDH